MGRPLNKYTLVSAVLLTATPFLLGYDLVMVCGSAVLSEAPDVKLLACIAVASCLLGAVAAVGAQCLAGDRYTVLLSAAALCAGALSRGIATSFVGFAAGMFVNGVGMGLALMAVPAYAGDLSPSSLSGGLTSHPEGFVYLGCIAGALCYSKRFLNLPVHVAWRVTVASGMAIPALLGFAVVLMPESPRWLLATDHVNKARRVLSRTSVTLEEAEFRLLEIKMELGRTPHDSCGETVATPARQSRWRDECGLWLELLARPTEPLRHAVVSALVAKVFQQASGIRSMFQYVERAFRAVGVSSTAQTTRALVAFALVVAASFSMSLVLVELGWLVPVGDHAGVADSAGVGHAWPRAVGGRVVPHGCPRWLWTAAADVNRAVSAAIFSSFVWAYEVTAVHVNLLVCPAFLVLAWFSLYACIRGVKER
uniref:Major facilitator superfamily (MFS) profile domain-containing protein n=1 Tax=Oryza brachyantha TaxID=4533 RepID=J3MMF0_ORYBR